ncbi:MAG: bifunctional glycosyltransferase family 2 protein/CDP-glycerol:glycerophosphate glycerophosphotransferase [Lachnospiraceae bacterium]|nr:bifunctional glycosyltransferase family 2 protein/CDP-glycerol:glycerophosphate glycerophosphotransferase [Lachnospiraceae bacterium]
MKYSIIIPFKRGKEYLRDCLDSLAEQISYKYLDGAPGRGEPAVVDNEGVERRFETEPYRDFEAVIVLDQPLDDVRSLIREYEDRIAVTVVDEFSGTGVSAARNAGIAHARGEYVYFLDSDDFLHVDALFRMSEGGEESEDPDILYGKKIWSWYSRSGYLAVQLKKQEEKEAEREKQARRRAGLKLFFNRLFKGKAADSDDDDDNDEDSEDRIIAETVKKLRQKQLAERADYKTGKRAEDERLRLKLELDEYEDLRRKNATRILVYNRNGIGNISVLHVAVKRSVVQEHNITFPEDIRYYADARFVCESLHYAKSFRKCYRSRYVKRRHNDPINFPSIAQENSETRFDELAKAYEDTMDRLPDGSTVRFMFDLKFIFYYTGFFVKQIRRSGSDVWRTARFETVRRIMGKIPVSTRKQVDLYKRRHIKALLADDADRAYKLVTRRLAVQKAWKCVISRSTRRKAIYEHIFLKKPVEAKWILFECFFGKSYGDNPKGIYEYIAKNLGPEYRLIWSMEKPGKSSIPFEHSTVRRGSLRYAYYVARCKFFVFNTKQPGWMKKRDEQVFLETWHGTPLKRLAFDMEDNFSAAPGYKKQIYGLTRKWDYLVSANAFSTERFRSCFMYNGKMLEYGYPRNDILHRPDREELAASIRKKLGIPADKKTILYAPTWRDDEFYEAGQYKFTLKLDLPKMKAALGDEYVILLRTHYYIADRLDVTGMEGFAYNLSKYDDIADIYLISDICITDYSSVFFDYANLKRPMLFYTYDIDKYRDMLRGFYFDMESTVPGPLLYTTGEVIDAIKDIDAVSARFAKRYDEFYDRFCGWENGHASENIVKEVILGQKN